MPSKDNPHRDVNEVYTLEYWNGNAASGREGADRVELRQFIPGHGLSTVEQFQLPSQEFELERLGRALARSFQAGRASAKAEIRKVLEI